MSKTRIQFGMDPEPYRELEHISRSIGLEINDCARFAVHQFLLSVKHSAIKFYLNDRTKLTKDAIEAMQQLYHIDMTKVTEDSIMVDMKQEDEKG